MKDFREQVAGLKIITVSGYKAHEIGVFKKSDPAVEIIKKAIKQQLLSRLDEGLEWVLISGQLGVELWAGEVVLELKDSFPELKLGILTAFEGHDEKWNEANQEMYQSISMEADFVDSISRRPYESPQQLKNKNFFHLQKSDGLLMVYDEEKEGSPKFLWELAKEYSAANHFELMQITFQDLQWIVEEEQFKNE
ncbi:DUF1273 domain-containing protein [Jeotgalibacillus proteolyticus]|uniref:UPF0398 protein C4B60_03940 n=1 Tax=Jeotgalibacillus proteolyticus TaxID=2082395 RepID=A0A2S5GFJ0_9BACL|nr:DUF1273 domain-containing protein [Jeotgalibacillus proteolyticus]PPA71766.1 hypothetical protein C4B60_03940 [Jeotgalibacillus proteolyticus]